MGENNQNQIFAKNLTMWLALKGKVQKDLVDKFGWSSSTVSDWCSGKKYPRMDKIQLIADYLGILKSDLVEEKVISNLSNPAELDEIDVAFNGEIRKLSKEDKANLINLLKSINKNK